MALAERQEWTLVAQKVRIGNSADSSLSTIKISYNEKGKDEFRIVNMIKGFDKRITISPEHKHTPADIDEINNSVLLKMNAKTWTILKILGARVSDRRIFYLEKDGQEFLKFLIKRGNDGLPDCIAKNSLTMDHFKRKTLQIAGPPSLVVGYTVTLSKDDWKNEYIPGKSLFGITQTSKLRVHMEADLKTVKHFELSQISGALEFQIEEIILAPGNERVLLKIERTIEGRERQEKKETILGVTNLTATNRWLYLNENDDSKRFLLLLLEMFDFSEDNTLGYCPFEKCRNKEHKPRTTCVRAATGELRCSDSDCNSKWTMVFSKSVKETLKCSMFNDDKGREIVKQHIDENSAFYGLALKENKQKFESMLTAPPPTPTPGRRRLAEAAYYTFIAFNVLLMCTILVGISCAYQVAREAHSPVRW